MSEKKGGHEVHRCGRGAPTIPVEGQQRVDALGDLADLIQLLGGGGVGLVPDLDSRVGAGAGHLLRDGLGQHALPLLEAPPLLRLLQQEDLLVVLRQREGVLG